MTSFTTLYPSDASQVAFGASDIRNAKRQIQRALEVDSNFLNTVTPVTQGGPRPGIVSAAPVFDDSKATTQWQYENSLVLRSDTSGMYSYMSVDGPFAPHSSSTWRLGTPAYVGSAITTWPEATWVELSGMTAIASASGGYTTNFGLNLTLNEGYDGIPLVFAHASANGVQPYALTITNVQPTFFSYTLASGSGAASNVTVFWRSLGTKARPI